MKRFMEEYVLTHRALPTGKHWIRVPGYSGPEHDFSDLVVDQGNSVEPSAVEL